MISLHTPGGAATNDMKSVTQAISGLKLYVKPHNESRTLDSLEVVCGICPDINSSFSNGSGAESYENVIKMISL